MDIFLDPDLFLLKGLCFRALIIHFISPVDVVSDEIFIRDLRLMQFFGLNFHVAFSFYGFSTFRCFDILLKKLMIPSSST